MDTQQISRVLEYYLKGTFRGVYAEDELPNTQIRPMAIIVNTDPSTESGTHWTAIYIHRNNMGEFFDSYGKPPDNPVQRFLNDNAYNGWIYNIRQVQGISTLCGGYCLQFLDYRHKNPDLKLETVLRKIFPNSDTRQNDFLVQKYLKKQHNIHLPLFDMKMIL